MAYGVRLHVRGERACFTRPEFMTERVSYDAITPSAARGILEAIHWKPGVTWIVDRVHVLRPIRFETVCRNEVGRKVPERAVAGAIRRGSTEGVALRIDDERPYRATMLLRDVAYVIEAHLRVSTSAGSRETGTKHLAMFNRRAARGQGFHRPYLGMREFPCDLAPVEWAMPATDNSPAERDRDLGWMLHDIDFDNGRTPRIFRTRLEGAVIKVPAPDDAGIRG